MTNYLFKIQLDLHKLLAWPALKTGKLAWVTRKLICLSSQDNSEYNWL